MRKPTAPKVLRERVVDMLSKHSPLSVADLTTMLQLGTDKRLRQVLIDLHTAGKIHVAAWQDPGRLGGRHSKMFANGPGLDAPYTGKSRGPHGRNAVGDMIMATLNNSIKPLSARDMSSMLDVSIAAIHSGLYRLHLKGEVYHAAWDVKRADKPTIMWAAGCEDDAPRPDNQAERRRESKLKYKEKIRQQEGRTKKYSRDPLRVVRNHAGAQNEKRADVKKENETIARAHAVGPTPWQALM